MNGKPARARSSWQSGPLVIAWTSPEPSPGQPAPLNPFPLQAAQPAVLWAPGVIPLVKRMKMAERSLKRLRGIAHN
jgi:hypothetical protein